MPNPQPPHEHRRVTRAQLHVLRSLVIVWRRDGRATFRSVARHADRSVSATWTQLVMLRMAGLASWEFGRSGTLRPLVSIVRELP